MDGNTAASASALLQAPACAVFPAVMGGSYDEGDQLATEVATILKSPATAVATPESGVPGLSHTELGTIELPDDDMIEVMYLLGHMPAAIAAVYDVDKHVLLSLQSIIHTSCLPLSVLHWKRRIMLLTSAVWF